jgi:hypothetical protein
MKWPLRPRSFFVGEAVEFVDELARFAIGVLD